MRPSSSRLGLLLLAVMVLLALLAPACSKDGGAVDADEIVARAAAAAGSVTAYRMECSASEDIRGEVDGGQVRGEVTTDMSVLIDITNEEMKAEMTIETAGWLCPGGSCEAYFEEYVIGGETYVGTWIEDGQDEMSWVKVDADVWEVSEALKQLAALLEQAEPEWGGEERVDGVPCCALEMSPDAAEMMNLYSQPGMSVGGGESPRFREEWFESAETTVWVARDTSHIMKAEVDMRLNMEVEDLDPSLGTGEVVVEIETEMLFSRHNEPVSIDLPPEAVEQTS